MSGQKFLNSLVLGLICGVALSPYIARAQNQPASTEQSEYERWEKYRDEVKIPAHPFPSAVAISLYVAPQGIRLDASGKVIWPLDPIPLSQSEIEGLQSSIFYGPPPYAITACMSRSRYTFRFFDKSGETVGILFLAAGGELSPDNPPFANMDTVILDMKRIDALIHHLASAQQVANNSTMSGCSG